MSKQKSSPPPDAPEPEAPAAAPVARPVPKRGGSYVLDGETLRQVEAPTGPRKIEEPK